LTAPSTPASLFNLQTFGNVYSRISNPTVAVFEERIASAWKGAAPRWPVPPAWRHKWRRCWPS
jgi:O-acetylhomoserine/O-acetylserine sulfhydrylase-like pyridoxal-dependent enzyme